MRPSAPDPVKLFIGLLSCDDGLMEEAVKQLSDRFGPVDYRSRMIPFEVTDYYQDEMGWGIQRIFLSFQRLIDPAGLADIKIDTNRIEDELAVDGRRKVNLDPGYMDVCKVVLASAKYNGQKVYLEKGIYADPTLHYQKGHFEPYPWSFPDFKDGRYESVFLRIRELYKVARRGHEPRARC